MKRILTLLLIVSLALSGLTASANAAAFADTDGKACSRAVEILKALDIVEGKTEDAYEPDSALTRAEMTTIILRVMQMEQGAKGSDVFEDVPSTHWAYANIATAYQMGIVNGTSETTFEPDKTVTYDQAVKMVVSALGYSVVAETMGGYPSGYLSKAAQLDILKGTQPETAMTRGNMAILLYNALEVELFLQSTFGQDTLEFNTDAKKTLLSHYLKVEHREGVVEATYAASMQNPAPKLLPDEVRVDGITIQAGNTKAQEMLGMTADIYTRKDALTEKPVILAILPLARVSVTDLTATAVENFEDLELTYTDAENVLRKADLSEAVVVFNGRPAAKDALHLMPAAGTIRLITKGNTCTCVIVESFKNGIVDVTNPEKHTVYFKNGVSPMTLDTTDKSGILFFTDIDGEPITVEDLMEWDVLSVAVSEDGEVTNVRMSFETVEGKVTEVSADDVTIDGESYVVAPDVYGSILVGTSGRFYQDFTGAIAAVDEKVFVKDNYGWLVSAMNTKGLNVTPQIKLFTENGKMQVFRTTNMVTLNGRTVKSGELLTPSTFVSAEDPMLWAGNTEAALMDASGKVIPQLLKYEINNDGLITALDTASNQSDPMLEYDAKYDDNFSMDWYYYKAYGSASSGAYQTEFNGKAEGNPDKKYGDINENGEGIFFTHVACDEDTTFFIIPTDVQNEKGYSILSLREFPLEEHRKSEKVSFYDVNENYHCGAMVMHNYLKDASGNAGAAGGLDKYPSNGLAPSLVIGISQTLSEDGMAQNTMRLVTSAGSEVSVIIEDGMEALYATATNKIEDDPAWYTKVGGEKKLLTKEEKLAYRDRYDASTGQVKKMYIAAEDIVPGDVVQCQTDESGTAIMLSVLFREKYSDQLELFQAEATCKIAETTKTKNYPTGGKMKMNGIVKQNTKYGIVIETYPVNATTGAKKDAPFVRSLAKIGRFVLWDRDLEEYRTISQGDIMPGDEVFTYWRNIYQLFTVVYRKR